LFFDGLECVVFLVMRHLGLDGTQFSRPRTPASLTNKMGEACSIFWGGSGRSNCARRLGSWSAPQARGCGVAVERLFSVGAADSREGRRPPREVILVSETRQRPDATPSARWALGTRIETSDIMLLTSGLTGRGRHLSPSAGIIMVCRA